MAWQIVEMRGGGPPDSSGHRGKVIMQDLAQSRAEGLVQRLNDAVNTDEFWFVAENQDVFEPSPAVKAMREVFPDLTDSEIEAIIYEE